MPLERAPLNNVTEQRTDGLFERVRTNVLKGNVPLKKNDSLLACSAGRETSEHLQILVRRSRRKELLYNAEAFLASLLVPAVAALGSLLANRLLPSRK